jgi:DNA polymerase-3 subunit delta
VTVQELAALLKTDHPTGCFLFCGEEAYLRRAYLNSFRQKLLVDPAFDTFNHLVHEGAEVDASLLATELETPPFFSPCKLIEWHMADFSSLNEKKLEGLTELAHIQAREDNAALVFLCSSEGFDPGTAKRPSSAYKKLGGILQIVNFEKSTDAQLLGWLKRHFDHENMGVEMPTLRAMLFRCGHSMDILANETEKLVCYARARGRSSVTEEDVHMVCASTTESDAFGLTNALLDGKTEEAYRNLRDLRDRRVDPVVIVGQISRLYGDLLSVSLLLGEGMNQAAIATTLSMNAYKVGLYAKCAAKRSTESLRRALACCTDADLTVKTSYGSDLYALLDCLVAALAQL